MRTSTAYFAGVGTVVVAVAAGLGGGYLAANVANPPTQTISKLERRMLRPSRYASSTAPAEAVAQAAATALDDDRAATGTAATAAPARKHSRSHKQRRQRH